LQSIQTQVSFNAEVPVAGEVSPAALSVVDLRKSFATPNGDRIEVLRGVTLDAQAGQTVAIIGASGSGKSTLLHLLGGLEDADHGTISLGGTDVVGLKGTDLANFRHRSIGFVFQFHYLLTDLTAVENIAMPLRIARYSSTHASTRARAVLNEVGLENREDYPISHLSGGEQQRVALARALVLTPQLLLADEPTGNLDASIGDEIGRIIVNFVRNQSRMAIIATHNESLAAICDRVMLLEGGRVRLI
jgi:lipoprotein-releasing system ATP-binding protein